MKRINLRLKKFMGSLLILGILGLSFLAVSSIYAEKPSQDGIVIMANQQKEINEVLAIKKIDEIKNFSGFQWLDSKKLLGVSIESGLRNISIYDIEDKSIEKLTQNSDPNIGFEFWNEQMRGLNQYASQNQYALFKKQEIKKQERARTYSLILYDSTEKKLVEIDNAVTTAQYIENQVIYYAKGLDVYRYDIINKERSKIALPEELFRKLNYYFESYDSYLEAHFGGEKEKLSDYWKQKYRRTYEIEKNNNYIERLIFKDGKLELTSLNLKHYIFDMSTNKFREGALLVEFPSELNINIQGVAVLVADKNPQELWETNQDGKLLKLVDKAQDFLGGFQLSPDKNKLIYEVAYPMGESKKYIYDFRTDKKLMLFGSYTSISWSRESDKIVCAESVYFDDQLGCKIIVLND